MNGKRTRTLRLEAVERYESGESATIICRSLGKSRWWLYKWIQRKDELRLDPGPKRAHNRMPLEVEKAVISVRKELQSTKHAQISVNAINRELYLQGRFPLPASTIKRILKREDLQRTKAPYAPKGKAYQKQEAVCANNIHQADLDSSRGTAASTA